MNNVTSLSALTNPGFCATTKGDYSPSLQACLALKKAVRKQAYELRHASYLAAGYMHQRAPGGILRDEFDESATSKTVVLYKNKMPAASARICLLDPTSSDPLAVRVPASEMFPNEIRYLMDAAGSPSQPARAVEVTKLSRHPDFVKDSDLVFAIFRTVGYLILHYEVDLVLIAVLPKHISFYQRLGYEVVAPPRNHPIDNATLGLMVCHKAKFDTISARFPIISSISRSDKIYKPFLNGNLVSMALPAKMNFAPKISAKKHFYVIERSNHECETAL